MGQIKNIKLHIVTDIKVLLQNSIKHIEPKLHRCTTYPNMKTILRIFVAVILIGCIDLHCISNSRKALIKATRRKHHSCRLTESKTGVGAGAARNINAKCHYTSPDDFHYVLSWSPPAPTRAPVTKYRVRIWFETYQRHICFQVPASQRELIFNQSMGLSYGCPFSFSVVAQPIAYTDNIHYTDTKMISGCPISPKLKPLPNMILQPGSNFSFLASFKEDPIPHAKVKWFFSPDKVNCSTYRRIEQNNVIVSEDTRVLSVNHATNENIGCYIAVASNGIDGKSYRRGYLDFESATLKEGIDSNILVLSFASLGATIIVLLFALLLVLYKQKQLVQQMKFQRI